MVKIQDIVSEFENVVPPWLSEDPDSVGLMLGDMNARVKDIAVGVKPSRYNLLSLVQEAFDLLVVHRPLPREPIRKPTPEDEWNRVMIEVIKSGKAVYVLGDSYDIVEVSSTDIACDLLKLPEKRSVLVPKTIPPLVKVVVFVPPEAVDAVRDAMADAGAGAIGNYSHCTFMTEGTGTFMPLEGTQPYSGEGIGKLAKEKEFRLETIIPENEMWPVIEAMKAAHPYEEVAYDIYPLLNISTIYGVGRVVNLEKERSWYSYGKEVMAKFGDETARVYGNPKRPIKRVAVYAGDGSDLVGPANKRGADVLIAGGMNIKAIEEAERLDLSIIDIRMDRLLLPGMESVAYHLNKVFGERKINVVNLDTRERQVFGS